MAFHFLRRSGSSQPEGVEAATAPRVAPEGAPACEQVDAQAQSATGFVTYAWLLDAKKQVIGYRLGWRPDGASPRAGAQAQFTALVDTMAQHFVHRLGGWRMGKATLFFDVTPTALSAVNWQGLPPQNVVLCWQPEHFLDPDLRPALEALREAGFGLMLCGAAALPEDKELRELITHFDVGGGDAMLIAGGRSAGRRPVNLIATRMDHWSDFDACAARRVSVLVNPGQANPAVDGPRRPLQPESLLVVRVMQMLQRNEDVREIEAALKHDAALTYRLLRHINSPVISAGVEIQSLRHAVAMLGYSPLFRWLSLLLATSNVKASPPFLMKKAIMRGRFVELLGQALLGPSHSDNLFLVGMFSVIDQLLGISMSELLEKVQLAEPVQSAIRERKGMYGPFLALALTCETDASEAARLAEELFISANQVNAAHLCAMVWSQEVSRVDADF